MFRTAPGSTCQDTPPPGRGIYLYLGNHISTSGLVEIVYSVFSACRGTFAVRCSRELVPDAVNVIIDDFADPAVVAHLKEFKRCFPKTKYLAVCIEFITVIHLLRVPLTKTFDFFSLRSDWRALVNILGWRFGLRPDIRYMHKRFIGFVNAIDLFDVIATLHPAISRGLKSHFSIESVPLHPVIDLEIACREERFRTLPFGFTMTGTRTPYRRSLERHLGASFAGIAAAGPVVVQLNPDGANAGRFDDAGHFLYPHSSEDLLFNFNVSQTPHWPYSSPMRILRAALVGQIPVIARKFGDHPIEQVAFHWDGSRRGSEQLWTLATMRRDDLVDNYLDSIRRYNDVAREANRKLAAALAQLLGAP